jgi:hypothetical protein
LDFDFFANSFTIGPLGNIFVKGKLVLTLIMRILPHQDEQSIEKCIFQTKQILLRIRKSY